MLSHMECLRSTEAGADPAVTDPCSIRACRIRVQNGVVLQSKSPFFCQLKYTANDLVQAECTAGRKLSQRWQKQRLREISHCFPSSDLLLMRSKEMEIIQCSGVNIYVY